MDIKSIKEEYRYTTELHAHTYPVSSCADMVAELAVEKYAKKGVDSVVITNHVNRSTKSAERYLSDYRDAKKAGEKYGINIILGVEICFTECPNDYLVFGIGEEDIEKIISYVPRGIERFYKDMKNDKNVILQAHPFRNRMKRVSPDFIDGIETFNMHPHHNSRVGRAALYARERDMLVSCGSDFHHPDHEALALLRSREPLKDSFEVAALIKSRDYLFDLSENIIFPY